MTTTEHIGLSTQAHQQNPPHLINDGLDLLRLGLHLRQALLLALHRADLLALALELGDVAHVLLLSGQRQVVMLDGVLHLSDAQVQLLLGAALQALAAALHFLHLCAGQRVKAAAAGECSISAMHRSSSSLVRHSRPWRPLFILITVDVAEFVGQRVRWRSRC
jgi:hypothetical protein